MRWTIWFYTLFLMIDGDDCTNMLMLDQGVKTQKEKHKTKRWHNFCSCGDRPVSMASCLPLLTLDTLLLNFFFSKVLSFFPFLPPPPPSFFFFALCPWQNNKECACYALNWNENSAAVDPGGGKYTTTQKKNLACFLMLSSALLRSLSKKKPCQYGLPLCVESWCVFAWIYQSARGHQLGRFAKQQNIWLVHLYSEPGKVFHSTTVYNVP